MLPVPRLVVLLVTSLASLIGVSLIFSLLGQGGGNAAMVPVFVIVELLIYFFLTLFSNPRLSVASVSVLSVAMVLVRLVCALIGGIMSGMVEEGSGSAVDAYAGSPVAFLIQVIILVLAMPHVLEAAAPELVSPELRDRLAGSARAAAAPLTTRPAASLDAIPSGGFIQVFSYEELAGVVRKTQGLEGFIIYSTEGLIVWRDLPMRLEADRLVARARSLGHRLADAIDNEGLSRTRKLMVETRDHIVFVTELNQNFGLILVYNAQTAVAECVNRVGVIAKTAREYLQWKYPGLPVTASLQSETKIEMM